MLFPISGVEINPIAPFFIAFIISFFTSMGGVSGAFLLLPFQMSFLGYTAPSVSATNQLFNVIAIPSGVFRYYKEGRMVWPLTWAVIIGTLPGVFIGAIIRIVYLPDPKQFKLFAALVLLYIGIRMAKDLIRKPIPGADKDQSEKRFQQLMGVQKGKAEKYIKKKNKALPSVKIIKFSMKRIIYEFYGQQFDISAIGVFSLSLIVGMVGGIYGIGGGSIIAPFFITFFGLPVYTVAGAALMGTFVTSFAGVAFYQVIAPFYPDMSISPDWLLGSFFGLGGIAGMYLGARFQKYVPPKIIKWMLCLILLSTAFKYIYDFFSSVFLQTPQMLH